MHVFRKLFATSLVALCLVATPAMAYEQYTYMIGNNYFVLFQGHSGNFVIDTEVEVKSCGGDSYETFFGALMRNESNKVLLQTYACGNYLKVCIDPNTDHNTFDPQSCATFKWMHSDD